MSVESIQPDGTVPVVLGDISPVGPGCKSPVEHCDSSALSQEHLGNPHEEPACSSVLVPKIGR